MRLVRAGLCADHHGVPDLRRLFTDRTAGTTHPGQHMAPVPAAPRLRLARFEAALVSVVNELRRLRAGHTPYGPAPGAGLVPPPWP